MAGVVRNDISNFLSKLDSIKRLDKTKIAETVGEFGEQTAKSYYNITPDKESSIRVGHTVNGNELTIYAEGSQVAYLEYGTGKVGQGTYQGQLPTQTLSFESPEGHPQTTQGWEYYYDNKLTKRSGGWFYKKGNVLYFTRGMTAKAQMFNTAQEIKRVYKAKRRK